MPDAEIVKIPQALILRTLGTIPGRHEQEL